MWVALYAGLALALIADGADRPATAGPASADAESTSRTFVARRHRKDGYRQCRSDDCFRAAFTSCELVHLEKRAKTIEGDFIYFDYYVVAQGATCLVEVVIDNTDDQWGSCEIDRMLCPTLEAALSDDPASRGCSPPETLHRASTCAKSGPGTPRRE